MSPKGNLIGRLGIIPTTSLGTPVGYNARMRLLTRSVAL